MKRLTIWITATVAAVAIATAIGMNYLGVGGKAGDEGDHGAPTTVQVTPGPTASAGDRSDDDGKTGGDANDQEGKPGENK